MIATIALAAALMLDPGSRPAPSATPAPVASAAPAKVRYCVENVTTGSRMARRTCMTRAEWLAQGFDPLNPED